LNLRATYSNSLLHMACEAGYTEIASVLMDAGAGDNIYIISYKKLDHCKKSFL